MNDYIGVPIGYLRGVPLIMPNAWRYVIWLFYIAVFTLFIRYGKVSLGIAKFVFELVFAKPPFLGTLTKLLIITNF